MKALFDMLDSCGGEILIAKNETEGGELLAITVIAKGETAKVLARAAEAISDGKDVGPV